MGNKIYRVHDDLRAIDTLLEWKASGGIITLPTTGKDIVMSTVATLTDKMTLPTDANYEITSSFKNGFIVDTTGLGAFTFYTGTAIDTFSANGIIFKNDGTSKFCNLKGSVTAGANKFIPYDGAKFDSWNDLGDYEDARINWNGVEFKNIKLGINFTNCHGYIINSRFNGHITSGEAVFTFLPNADERNIIIANSDLSLPVTNFVADIRPGVKGQFTFTDDYFNDTASLAYFKVSIPVNISAFANSSAEAGVKTKVTSTAHGLSNGDFVNIKASYNYWGIHQISNITVNEFDIPLVFIPGTGSETADYTTGSLDETDAQVECKNNKELADSVVIGNAQIAVVPGGTAFTVVGSGAALTPIVDTSGTPELWLRTTNTLRSVVDRPTGKMKFDITKPTHFELVGTVTPDLNAMKKIQWMFNGSPIANTNMSEEQGDSETSMTVKATILVSTRDDFVQIGIQRSLVGPNMDVFAASMTCTRL